MKSTGQIRFAFLAAAVACATVAVGQKAVRKAPTAEDWTALAKLPDFTGVWEAGLGGGGGGGPLGGGLLGGKAAQDLPLSEGEWSLWSTCRPGLSTYRYRYRQCQKLDPRQCESQRLPCTVFTDPTPTPINDQKNQNAAQQTRRTRVKRSNLRVREISESACHALILNGRKLCSVGVRSVGGKLQYCGAPPDC